MKTIPNAPAIYNADIYLRLSRDDDNKGESNSIVNQKELIKNFLKSKPEIKVNDIKVDDGYTGVNFDRPAFIEMLSEIRSGKVNCVVVKDMSRFGRNYIEVGKYITDVFPFLGVRFIAINDNIDTALTETSSELTIFHFKNLLNDAYCNDISIKVRSQLDIKRKNGDFIGSFAPYGYLKSADNKNKLVVDESVRSVIEEIFNLKISGYSALRIADKLNECGIASPMEHKKELGEKFNTVFRKNAVTKWDANSVLRILKNKVYIGTLQQSKSTTPNYKIKKRIQKSEKDWICVKNNHEAIISSEDFKKVQRLLLEDTRVSPKNNSVYVFSGIAKCGKCGGNLTRKVVSSGRKKFVYYVCISNKAKCGCDNKMNYSYPKLDEVVLSALNAHIKEFVQAGTIIRQLSEMPFQNSEIKRINAEIESKKKQIEANKRYSLELYNDMKENIIDKNEYITLKNMYAEKNKCLESAVYNLENSINVLSAENNEIYDVFEKFSQFGEITEITRDLAVSFIERINVYSKNEVEIIFRYSAEYALMRKYIQAMAGIDDSEREVF